MLTIDPRPARFIARKACFAHSQAPFRSTANTRSHSASVISVASKYALTPALFTSTSIAPRAPATASIARRTSPSAVTSARRNSTTPPPRACTTSRAAASSRSTNVTSAPSSANFSTIARPMPRAPPVTNATLPASRRIGCVSPALPARARALAERLDVAGGGLDEVAHRRAGAARIARANRVQDGAMLRQRRLGASGQPTRGSEADEERRIHHTAHLLEQIVAARLEDHEVELHVRLDERLEIGTRPRLRGMLHLLERVFERRDVLGVGAGSGKLRSRRFDDTADLGQLAQQRIVDRAVLLPGEDVGIEQVPRVARTDARAGFRPRLDEPFGGEHFHRLAHDRAARAEIGLGRQQVARPQIAAEDAASD